MMAGLTYWSQLHEEAVTADERVQRIKRLHLIEFAVRQEALTQGRDAEIYESRLDLAAAKPAARGAFDVQIRSLANFVHAGLAQ